MKIICIDCGNYTYFAADIEMQMAAISLLMEAFRSRMLNMTVMTTHQTPCGDHWMT